MNLCMLASYFIPLRCGALESRTSVADSKLRIHRHLRHGAGVLSMKIDACIVGCHERLCVSAYAPVLVRLQSQKLTN